MKKKLLAVILLFFACTTLFSQVVINELDCDTPGIDDQEFVELKSDTPNFSLDGYVLVFFNGSSSGGDSSYMTIDLDGAVTDVNGLLLIGSSTVTPFPQFLISPNVIQNGADAVAIYLGDDTDFPEGTLATQTNLIDALAYDTNDSDDTNLMALLGLTEQISEGASNNTNSIQRNDDGSYTATTPTPRALNEGGGVLFNAISISTALTQYGEGDTFDITFTAQENVTEDFQFDFTLNNGTFDTPDFTGTTTVTISNGQNAVTTSITIIDDAIDEGDEELLIRFSGLEPPYIPFNNFIKIRVIDNDFTVAPFGTPINPTYGVVESTQPSGYYNSLDELSDTALRQALQDIIAEEGVVRAQTYTDVIDILKEADQNPENSNQVWLVYLEQGRAKLDFQTTSNNVGTWNREHTFPRSRGGFDSIEEDEVGDGIDIFWNTTADSLRHGNSDAHALRAVDGPENSSRGNQFYGEYNGPSGTLGGFKGDVARSVFYMAVRYNGLEIVNGFPEGLTGQFGDLATLLDWHRNDPPDDFEMNRNNVVYQWQFNRNPFIDQPDLVEYIWGNMVGQVWNQELGIDDVDVAQIKVYPNPTSRGVHISGINNPASVEVFAVDGRKVYTENISGGNSYLNINFSPGMYLLNIVSEELTIVKKIIVE
ncbi:endonuclease [Gaetbulibacter jejuensis]|uniref:endonuclease n=1 Tax=Gaetbulibacter jejuensis TaxID=584607 RepID=UPI003009483C